MLPWMIRAAALVPLLAGGGGAMLGPAFLGEAAGPATESHLRYLSGLLLGLGVVAAWCAADLPRRRDVFLALALLVAMGGLARLGGLAAQAWPPFPHDWALLMELGVVPLLAWAAWRMPRKSLPG